MDKIENRRLKTSNLTSFLVLGFLEAAFAPMVPYIKERFDLDEGSLGLLLLCTGIGSFLSLPLVGAAVGRFGCRKATAVTGLAMGLLLLTLALSQNLYLTGVALFVFGAATIGIDVSSNVNAVLVEEKLKRPLMSGFHAGYSLGTLGGSMLVTLLLTMGLGLVTGSVTVLIIGALAVFFGTRYLISDVKGSEKQKEAEEEHSQESEEKVPTIFGIPTLILIIGCMCFIMYSLEGAVMSWSGVFVTQERGMPLEVAGFIYSSFAIAMTVMRFVGNKMVSKIGRRLTVVVGSLLVSLGFMLTVLINHPIGAALGFLTVGLGAANIVPQLVSFAGSVPGISVHRAITFINALGYSGILCGPVIIGFTSKLSSLSATFTGIAVIVLIVGIVGFKVLRIKKKGVTAGSAAPAVMPAPATANA